MKKTIFAMAAILIAGLFTSCEKDSETPETPETETYRTLLTGDWYVTDLYRSRQFHNILRRGRDNDPIFSCYRKCLRNRA